MAVTTKLFTVEGDDALVANVKRLETALIEAAGKALHDNAEITLRLMSRLAPEDKGNLKGSIRFSFGQRAGEARSTTARTGRIRKTNVVGYIIAGDESTIVGKKRKWNNARLQEFGTLKMAAHPFFFPAWRATRGQFKKAVAGDLRRAVKQAMRQAA